MSEELVVRHCAPTLAGLKTANMFTCAYESEGEMRDQLREWNHKLGEKGVRTIPLRYKDGKALVYVYRPDRLRADLCDRMACELLQERGYPCETPCRCLSQLVSRLQETSNVPHEIGLFLGYPPEDVSGFLENRVPHSCPGPWRVYGNVEEAKVRFDQYKKCTKSYCEHWKKGCALEQLTVKS